MRWLTGLFFGLLLVQSSLAQQGSGQILVEEPRVGVGRAQEQDLHSMLNTQLEQNAQLVYENTEIRQANKELEDSKSQLSRELRTLREALQLHASYDISAIYVDHVIPTDRKVTAEIGTDQFGRIVAALFCDGVEVERFEPDPDHFSKTHVVTFQKILPEKNYQIKIWPLDRGGRPLPVGAIQISGRDRERLSFTTPAWVNPPTVTMLPSNDEDIENDRVKLRYRVTKDSIIVVECKQRIGGLHEWKGCPAVGTFRYDSILGVVSGEIVARAHQEEFIEINNLIPGAEYDFSIYAYEKQYGYRSEQPLGRPIYHTKSQLPFAFTGPIQLALGPNGLDVSWKATQVPVSATLELQLTESIKLINDSGAKIDGQSVTASISRQKALGALGSRDGDRTELPKIKVTMKNRKNEEVVAEFVIGIVVPTDPKKMALSDGQKDAAEKFAEALREGKNRKFSWSELSGYLVPILISFL